MKLILTNPSENHVIIGEINVSTKSEIKDKIAESKKAQIEWAAGGIDERIKCKWMVRYT